MAFQFIIAETRGHVGIVRLDRPKKYNALSPELLEEVSEALRKFDSDSNIRCMVLTGSDSVFSAGADIKHMSGQSFADMFSTDAFARESEIFLGIRKPVIAAVAGFALGGGCELAMQCDIVIAAADAEFGQPEITLGVMPGMGGTQRLTRAVGKSKSMEMNLTGRRMDATEAERAGLVSRVVPNDKLMDEALKVAGKIADQPPLAVIAAKEAVNRAEELPLREGLLFERRLFHALFATEDKNAGMQAFVEKRQAHFRGF